MSHSIACFRCGASLAHLPLPLSRQDSCSECGAYLHVCRMCRSFDKAAVDQCTEDDAERVREKEQLNFCDWFVASEGAFDPNARQEHDEARAALDSLFGDMGQTAGDTDSAELAAAEALFSRKQDK